MIVPGKVSGYQSGAINGLIDAVNAIRPRPSATVRLTESTSGTTFDAVMPLTAGGGEFDYRFKLSYENDTPAIRVREGSWTRFDGRITLTVDAGENYKSITSPEGAGAFAASTTYYVYAQLNATVGDPATNPNTITVHAATSIPSEPAPPSGKQAMTNRYWLLGTALTNADSEFESVTQWWFGGDIDNITIIPDGESAVPSAGTDTINFSLDFNGNGNNHSQCLELYQWYDANDAANTGVPEYDPAAGNGDLLTFRSVEAKGGNEYFQLKYCTISQAMDYVDLDYITESTGGTLGSLWSDYFNSGGGTWWKVNGTFNSTNYGSSIGRVSGGVNKAIDLDGSTLHDTNSSTVSLDFDTRIAYDESTNPVFKWTNTAWYLTFETTNTWTEGVFKVDIDNDMTLAIAGDLIMDGNTAVDSGELLRLPKGDGGYIEGYMRHGVFCTT